MHTITLKIHDSIYERVMGLLEILPKDKIDLIKDEEYPAITFDEASRKVKNAIESIDMQEGVSLESAFDRILNRV